MNNEFDLGQDFEFESNIPNYAELNDLNEFERKEDNTISDEEFNDLLIELGIINSNDSKISEPLNTKEDFESEKELVYSKLKLEWEVLEYEKAKFKREKEEWNKFKKLSEESFQAEKEEFERKKQIEIKKIYLETREKISSYKTYEDFLEDYKKILDVSE